MKAKGEQRRSPRGQYEGHAAGQVRRQPRPGLRAEREPAGDVRPVDLDPLGVRQVLGSDPGVRPVRAHEDVPGRRAAVGEVGRDPAVIADLEALEAVAEVHDVVQPGEQQLPQHHPADAVLAVGRVGGVEQLAAAQGEQLAEPLGPEGDVARRGRGGDEGVPQRLR